MTKSPNRDYACSPGPSVQEILATDRTPTPPVLRVNSTVFLGDEDLLIDAYTSTDYHRGEVNKMWRRVWQIACREEDISKPGDYLVYDIADDSIIVLRDSNDHLRAFHNSCLHRGARLCNGRGNALHIRCPYHGFSWHLDGRLSHAPCQWDFPHIQREQFSLPGIPVSTWGGFVFINMNPQASPLSQYLEALPDHFQRWPLEKRFKAAHVGKPLNCNWKVALEGFIERFHAVGIHAQTLPFSGDINTQLDVWPGQRHYSRMISLAGVPSPHVAADHSQQQVLDAAAEFGLCERGTQLLPGESARTVIAKQMRRRLTLQFGIDLSKYADSEIIDTIEYNLFPNTILFGGFSSPLVYRVRPDGDAVDRCLLDVMVLLPYPDTIIHPEPATLQWISEEQKFADIEALGRHGPLIDRYTSLLPLVQRGLRASRKPGVTPANYQEVRIRHLHNTLNQYLRGTHL